METTPLEDLSVLLLECVQELSALEAALIGDCYLAEPRTSLKAFAAEHSLRPTEMAELRIRAMKRLREELAAKNVHDLADIL